jgi:hypothetical protein
MPALATWAPEDGVLGAIAPLALAIAQPNSPATLVVDLDPHGPGYPSDRTLRDLVVDGPRSEDLNPSRVGVAVVANGGVSAAEAGELLEVLTANWPAIVLRLPPQVPDDVPAPTVPVRLLTPGRLFPPQGRGVYQPIGPGERRRPVPPGSLMLPAAPRRTIGALLSGGQPVPGRWLSAWAAVWETPW